MTVWHDEDYSKRVKLTIDGTKIEGDLTDFPVAIQLSDSAGITSSDLSSIIAELATTSDGVDSYTEFLLQPVGDAAGRHIITPYSSGNTFLYSNSNKTVYGGSSLYFNGTASTSINVEGNLPDFDLATEDFTIDWWEYRLDTTNSRVVLCGAYNVASCGIICGYGPYVYMSSNGSSWDIASSKTLGSIVANAWSHLAVVRTGETFYTFRDGVQQDTWSHASAIYKDPTWYPMVGSYYNLSSGYCFYGYIQGLRVSKGIARWTTTFSGSLPETIQEVDSYTKLLINGDEYDAGSYTEIAFAYGASNKIPAIEPTTGAGDTNHGGSYLFSGNKEFLYSTDNSIANFESDDFTIDFWVKRDSTGQEDLIAKWTRGSVDGGWNVFFDSDNTVKVYIYNGATTEVVGETTTQITDIDWHHVAVVRYGADWYIFLDGVIDSYYYSISTIYTTTQYLSVGRLYNSDSYPFSGKISNVRVSNAARWTKNFTPPNQKYDGTWVELVATNEKKIALYNSETEQCHVEIEDWNYWLQVATLWAKVPTLSSGTDKELLLYYDNTQSDNTTYVHDLNSAGSVNVWDSNYKVVYHLADILQNSIAITDSTSYDMDSTVTGTSYTDSYYGDTGKGLDFDGTNKYITIANHNHLDSSTGDFTISVVTEWDGSSCGMLLGKYSTSGFYQGPTVFANYATASGSAGSLEFGVNSEQYVDTSNSSYNDGVVRHWVFQRKDDVLKIFVNGSLENSNSVSSVDVDNAQPMYIFGNQYSQHYYGTADKFWFSPTLARSDAWIKADYNSSFDILNTYVIQDQPIFYYSGIVKIQGVPTQRTVCLYNRTTGELIGTALSDPVTGWFIISSGLNNYHFVVILPELSDDYDIIAHDKIHPEN